MKPLVSIIIPTWNRVHFLGETLDSIIAQKYEFWECLIIDDGSNDYTFELLEFYCAKDPRFKWRPRPEHLPKGANSCRNFGFRLSNGKYTQWFDSDDIMHPDKLADQVNALEMSSYGFSVCQTLVFRDNIRETFGLRHQRITSENFFEDYLMFKILWLTQAPLWRRDFLEQFDHHFDEELEAAQEWEFHVRVLYSTKEYHFTQKALVYLRDHTQNISNDDREKVLWNYFLARLKIFRRFKNVLSSRVHDHLLIYFLNAYKNALRNGQMKLAFCIWSEYITKADFISSFSKLRLGLAYVSFRLFKKGNIFISYLNK